MTVVVVTPRHVARARLAVGSTVMVIKSSSADTLMKLCFPFVRSMLSVAIEQMISSSAVPRMPSRPAVVAHVVVLDLPPGLPSARAHTVHVVETSAGSWKSAPFESVAFASSTWNVSPAGAGCRKILFVLMSVLASLPLRLVASSPPLSCTKMRWPSPVVIDAVLSFGTPMMLRL
jgi:hypothetical protein